MFADASSLIADNPPGHHGGIAVLDADGDGRFEFVIAGLAGPNRVLKWAGGQLRDVRIPSLADPHRRTVGLAAGDLDGDGEEELYAVNAEAGDRLWKRHPDGRWENLFDQHVKPPTGFMGVCRGAAAIDRRGIGRYGFFTYDWYPALRLCELGPDGTFADLAPSLGVTTPRTNLASAHGGGGAVVAPLFGAAPDLFCGSVTGPNALFRNPGDGTFQERAGPLGLSDPEEPTRAAAAIDAGGGRLGLCWGNWEGPHRLAVPQPDGPWKDRATPGLALPSAVWAVVAADFDNDGHDELFFHNVGEPNRLFRLTPGSDPSALDVSMLDPLAALDPEGHGTGAAVADIDGDGVLELLVARGESDPQPLGVYKSRAAAGNGWLRVAPLTRFGAPARGAVVRAEVGGRVRTKVIDGGGSRCQSEPVAHFGLGRGGRVGSVTVTWPDGTDVTFRDPDGNCTYSVPYPRG